MGRDQLISCGHVYSHVTGRNDWGASYPHVDLFCPSISDHIHNPPAGGASDYAVVHHDDFVSLDVGPDRVHLEPDRRLSHHLVRHDKGPADVPILEKTLTIGNSRTLVKTYGRSDPRIGNWSDHVCIGRVLVGQGGSNLHPDVVDQSSVHDAVRSCEINVLKNAMCWT